MTDQAQRERQSLQRIIATLFSLACLAFRASTASDAKRRYVLWVLRPAVACARDAVIGLHIDRRNYPFTAFTACDDSPEDALRLAQTFCVLAVLHHYVLVKALPKRGSWHSALDSADCPSLLRRGRVRAIGRVRLANNLKIAQRNNDLDRT